MIKISSIKTKLSFILVVALTSVFCTHTIADIPADGNKAVDGNDSLYVVHSVGAFANDRLGEIYPQEASVVFDWTDADNVSIIIKYSWRQGSSGFWAEIPNVSVTGSRDDFKISEKDSFEAHCKIWDSSNVEEKTIPITINSSIKKSDEGVKFSFVLTPSDNRVFPVLKISEVSTKRVHYERTGGDIVEFPSRWFVFSNDLDSSVTVQWNRVLTSPLELDSKASRTFYPYEVSVNYILDYLIDTPEERQSYPAIVTAQGVSKEIDFFAVDFYSKEDVSEFRLASGEIEAVGYTVYSFAVTSALLD